MHNVAKILATHMLSENTVIKESDEDELAGNKVGFDLNVEEFSSARTSMQVSFRILR